MWNNRKHSTVVCLIRERNEVSPTVTLAFSLKTISRGQHMDREPKQSPQVLLEQRRKNGVWGDQDGRNLQGRALERRQIHRGVAPEIHLGICLNCGLNTVLHAQEETPQGQENLLLGKGKLPGRYEASSRADIGQESFKVSTARVNRC